MKKDWKYIAYVSAAVILFIVVKMMQPKQFDWTVTFAHDDKDPYGGYCLYSLLPPVTSSVRHNYKTLYEVRDSIQPSTDIFILSSKFSPGKADIDVLLDHVSNGGRALISAQTFSTTFSDTLKIEVADRLFGDNFFSKNDSAYLRFSNSAVDTLQKFWFKSDNIHNYFNRVDSLRTTIVARNDKNQPVTVKIKLGKGYLLLNTTPLAFTNIYLLNSDNHKFVSGTLAYLKDDLYWTEYYHLGRREVSTPLRFILSSEPLSWAYYVSICAVVLFMVFEAKRRQRIIPVITPLRNTTLEFVGTIGNLYYQTSDHKNIAGKKIQFLFDQIRTTYRLETNNINEDFLQMLAVKAGVSINDLRVLFTLISEIQSSEKVSSGRLLELNSAIEKFYNN